MSKPLCKNANVQVCQCVSTNKSKRTTVRPLGIYIIEIPIYILNTIHFLRILGRTAFAMSNFVSLRFAHGYMTTPYPSVTKNRI